MRVITAGGETIELGDVETTPTIGITDYSRRVTDDFGVTTVVERGFARKMSVKLGVPFVDVDALQRRLAALRATPALWVADDRYASLSVRGFYKEFDLDLAVPPLSYCTLTVEGLADTVALADPGSDPAPAGLPSTLQLVQPVIMTASVLASSNVAEADAAEWVDLTSYPIGARVIKAATHRIYESLVDANVGSDPAGTSGKWLDVGPTNRWAMFDQALGTSTSAAGSIIVTLDAGTAGAVALLDVAAATVRVQANAYDRTLAAGAGAITFLDLPAVGQVTVTIAGPGTVSVGTLLIGRVVSLGITEASPTAGITDFSKKTVDDFGEVTIVQRAFTKRMTAKALIRTDAIDLVANRIAAVRARPSLWIGQAGIDSLTVYGFFKDFSIEVGETLSKLSLSIEGLSAATKFEPLSVDIGWDDIKDDNPAKPKPADGATVGAPAGTNVAGRPAEQVIAGIDGNTFNQVLAVADAERARLRTRALNFPGSRGEDQITLLRREVAARQAFGMTQKAAWTTLQDVVQVEGGSTRSVLSMLFVKEDADSALDIQAFLSAGHTADLQFDLTVQIDGMVMLSVPGTTQAATTPFVLVSAIARGVHTIAVKIHNGAIGPMLLQPGTALKIVELRKTSIGAIAGSGAALPPVN